VARIFISYRRDDTSGEAGRLADELTRTFGRQNVFIDVDAVAPGTDFEQRIRGALDSSDVVLVLIGDRWLTDRLADGRRRIDDEHDYVRMEVAGALGRTDATVVPVLVEGATMPRASDLPTSLAPLATRNAVDLAGKRWPYDVGVIVDLARGRDRWWRRAAAAVRRRRRRVVAAVALLAIGVGAYLVFRPSPASSRLVLSPASIPPVVDECTQRVRIGADGDVAPITCDGKLNVVAWQYLAKQNPLVLSLGPRVIPDQVLQAMCSDLQKTTGTRPLEATAYDLAKLYYGWRFGVDPKSEFLAGDC